MNRETVLSSCRRYRYTLWREWDSTLPALQVIGLNPSTADETQDDPTIRRCVGYAKRWGFGALCMTNLFAWRDTTPRGMKDSAEPVGVYNDAWLLKVREQCSMVLAAWGTHGAYMNRAAQVERLFPEAKALAVNADGSPKHPLYCRNDLVPQPLRLVVEDYSHLLD